VLRWIELSVRTFHQLLKFRPRALLVQNPSVALALVGVALRPLFGYRLCVDAHNEAVEPCVHPQPWVVAVARWLLRRADITLVSNRYLAEAVARVGGRPFVLPDRIPSPPVANTNVPLSNSFNIVLISSFAADEPIAAVIDAARGLDLTLYVTGNHRKLDPATAATLPPNVHLTGFLSETAYWDLLHAADAVIDLTTMDNCLVCGAYEATALAKPTLLSNNRASVELFGDSALFTDNSVADIRRCLTELKAQRPRLIDAAQNKSRQLREAWLAQATELTQLLVPEQSGRTRSESA
jgi:hypothetical protein